MGVAVSSSHVVSAAPSSLGKDSSHSAPTPVWGPSCGRQSSMNFYNTSPSCRLQFFMNCSGVDPLHGVQSFRNRLLQRGSPTESQVLPTNLLWRGLLSPWVHRSCQEPAPAWAPHGVAASFRHPPALVWGPPWDAGGYLLHHGLLHGLQRDSLPHHGLLHGLPGKISAPVPGAPPPPPSSLTLVTAGLFLSFCFTPHSNCSVFFPPS